MPCILKQHWGKDLMNNLTLLEAVTSTYHFACRHRAFKLPVFAGPSTVETDQLKQAFSNNDERFLPCFFHQFIKEE